VVIISGEGGSDFGQAFGKGHADEGGLGNAKFFGEAFDFSAGLVIEADGLGVVLGWSAHG
jgi:hypothetical protein